MDQSGITLVDVSGSARECGRQHGEAAREQIGRSIAFYREAFERSAKLSWAEVQERAPRWVPLIEAYLPGITDEIRGIAEGSGRNFEEILALNGRGELSWQDPFLDPALDDAKQACSSFAITPEAAGDGHVYCGQNWDWRDELTDTVILLRIQQPPNPTIIMQTEAGQIGRQGANSAGLALNANGLGSRFGSRLGLPQPYIRRRILNSPDLHDALEAIFSAKQSSCTNLLLTHRDGIAIDLETTPARHGWMYPTDGLLVHANHFMAFVPEQIAGSYRPFSVDSLYRVSRIQAALKHSRQATTPEAMRSLIADALRDHFSYPNSVCKHTDERKHPLDRTETISSNIVDLTTGEYYAVAGRPCAGEYQRLPWNLYGNEQRASGTAEQAVASR